MRLTTLLLLGLCCVAPAFGDTLEYTFATTPASGQIDGVVGEPIGWGYEIDNLDPANWLFVTNLDPGGGFPGATAITLFDFPILAPGEDLIVPFDPIAGVGLYEVVWDAGTAAGTNDQGAFTLSADWYDGDPTAGGNFIESASPQSASYSVTLASAETPEPDNATLFLLGLASLWIARRRFCGADR